MEFKYKLKDKFAYRRAIKEAWLSIRRRITDGSLRPAGKPEHLYH